MCMGAEPAAGFETTIGKAMVEQRSDYVTGAPAINLLREIDGLIESTSGLGSLPALFIAAKQDVLLTVERVERLAKQAANSTVQVVDSSHLEAPEKCRAAIIAWLARL